MSIWIGPLVVIFHMRFHLLDLTFNKFNFYHHCCFKNSVTEPLLYLVNYWSKNSRLMEQKLLEVLLLQLVSAPKPPAAAGTWSPHVTGLIGSRPFCFVVGHTAARRRRRFLRLISWTASEGVCQVCRLVWPYLADQNQPMTLRGWQCE